MTNDSNTPRFLREACLTDEDLYGYISNLGHPDRLMVAESHLAKCSHCRKALAELLELLHPGADSAVGEIPQPSRKEVAQTIAKVREVSHKERGYARGSHPLFLWPIAAAAVFGFVAVSLF